MRPASEIPGVLALTGLVLLAAVPLHAQEAPRHRSGFWLTGGLGGGVDADGEGGIAGYLRLGGTLGPRVVLGGEGIAFTVDEGDDATLTRSNATATALFYPVAENGLFLKGGIGFATAEASVEQGDVTITVSDEGFGATLGAGYDVHLGDGNLYVTPGVDVLLQSFDDIEGNTSLFLFTVGIGFH